MRINLGIVLSKAFVRKCICKIVLVTIASVGKQSHCIELVRKQTLLWQALSGGFFFNLEFVIFFITVNQGFQVIHIWLLVVLARKTSSKWSAAKNGRVCVFFGLLTVVVWISSNHLSLVLICHLLSNFKVLVYPNFLFVFTLNLNCYICQLVAFSIHSKGVSSHHLFFEGTSPNFCSTATIWFRLHQSGLSLIKSKITI